MMACPISLKQIDSSRVRIFAMLTALLGVLFLATNSSLLISLFFIDFILRNIRPSLSPLFPVVKFIQKFFNISPQPVDSGAKEFALQMGLAIVGIIFVTHMAGLNTIAMALTGILVLFASAEATINFCIGCHIYSIYLKLRGKL
jgi:Domain of unknown function (DUF4395)